MEVEFDADSTTRVTRVVTSREHQGRPAHVLTATRSYDTTVEDLWDALTSAERIPRWFLPVSGDLRLGGRFQFEGNAGGDITRCEPPRLLMTTWEFGGTMGRITVRLSAGGPGEARLELEHTVPADGDLWDQFGPGAVGVGWDLAMIGLGIHLATGAAVDRAASLAWPASAVGRAFVDRSSVDWARASVTAGTDPAAATAAAARTTVFYTGDE